MALMHPEKRYLYESDTADVPKYPLPHEVGNGSIVSEFKYLSDEVGRLEVQLESVFSRLTPVCAPLVQERADKEPSERAPSCEMNGLVRDIRDRIKRLNYATSNLLESLQL